MKYNTPFNMIDIKGQRSKKQKESMKIIDNLLKQNNGKCKGGAMANLIGNFAQNKDLQEVLKFYKIIMREENKNIRRAIISIPLIYFSLKLEREEEKKDEQEKNDDEKKYDTKVEAENQKGGAVTPDTETISNDNEDKITDKNDNKSETPINNDVDKTNKNDNKSETPINNDVDKTNKNEGKISGKNVEKKNDNSDEKLNEKNKTKHVCENHNNNKIKDEKSLKIPEKYIVNGTIDYKMLRENYITMIENPPQSKEKKSLPDLDFFKKKRETDKLFEKGDIKSFLNELNKIDIQDLPIELVSTLFFIKDEIDGKIDIAEEKQQKGEKTGLEGLIDEKVPEIQELKNMLKVVRKVCPIATIITRFTPKLPEDEFGILNPEIFCALLKLLDKLDKKKFEATMPSYDEKKLKLIIFKTIINDLNNGIPVTSKCGFFPAKIGDIKENAIGPGVKNTLMNNPMLARFKQKFGSQDAVVGEIFSYAKDLAEILCEYGIDLELILYNANKNGIQTGIILELLFKEIAKEIEGTIKIFGFSVEDATGFSVEKIINKIFVKLYNEGLYNCPNRHASHQNIYLHKKTDKIETQNNPNNKIRKLFNGDFSGGMASEPTGRLRLDGNVADPLEEKFPIGRTRKKRSRKPKTRKRYKR
jgi:hypothetical protein